MRSHGSVDDLVGGVAGVTYEALEFHDCVSRVNFAHPKEPAYLLLRESRECPTVVPSRTNSLDSIHWGFNGEKPGAQPIAIPRSGIMSNLLHVPIDNLLN